MKASIHQARLGEADGEGHWLVISDLMASLMMIFLFLALLHMVQTERFHRAETEVRETAAELRQNIYAALDEEFRQDLDRWNAELDRPTLTLRFREPDVLFDRNSSRIKPEFTTILNDFLPRYVARLAPFRDVIREIRIEGHTSSEWNNEVTPLQAYFANMELSQKRTQAVLHFAYGLASVQTSPWFQQRVAAVGLSSSRPIMDRQGHEDPVASRRVEFSVLTDFEARLLARPATVDDPLPAPDRDPGFRQARENRS